MPGAVNAALDAIAGAGVGAQNYMVMATAAAFLPYAEAKNKRDLLQYQDAVAIEQAAQQRNTQWASEERLFARIVRPMMTFFEAFLFAVSPLMVFAIGLGPVGIRMVGKYLLFGLWIQLWQPILAIINLYLLMAIRFKMDALQDAALGNTPLPSIEAIWKLDFLLSDYLGVGGMLAASTPAISLMLIYGSAITATHLAGRLQGGDYINEKIASPDVVNPAAALTVGPLQDHGPIRGTAAPGAESVTWTANVGQEVQRDLRSSQQAMERSSQGFASALSSAASLTASRSGESFENHASTWMKEGAKSATDQVVWQTAEGLTRQYSQSGLSTQSDGGDSGWGAWRVSEFSGLVARTTGSARADIGSGSRASMGSKSELADRMATDIARQVTSNEGLETRIAEALKVDSQAGDRNVFTSQVEQRGVVATHPVRARTCCRPRAAWIAPSRRPSGSAPSVRTMAYPPARRSSGPRTTRRSSGLSSRLPGITSTAMSSTRPTACWPVASRPTRSRRGRWPAWGCSWVTPTASASAA